jgi:hypothetical protein
MPQQTINPLTGQFDQVGAGGGGGGSITLTGNDSNPQNGTSFSILGIDGFLFDWNSGTGSFNIIPPNTFTWAVNSIVSTSGALLAGNCNILTNPSATTVSLPANSGTHLGDLLEVIGLSGGYTISQAADQQVTIGAMSSTLGVGGSVTSSGAVFNSVTLRCVSVAGGVFIWAATTPPQGTFTTN